MSVILICAVGKLLTKILRHGIRNKVRFAGYQLGLAQTNGSMGTLGVNGSNTMSGTTSAYTGVRPTTKAHKLTRRPVIDGEVLADSAWSDIPAFGGAQSVWSPDTNHGGAQPRRAHGGRS